MLLKLLTGLVGSGFAIAFFAVPVIKLADPALIAVVLIGIALMAVDLFEKVRTHED